MKMKVILSDNQLLVITSAIILGGIAANYKDGLMFPPKSNQKMNDNLKEIARMLGFGRVITKMQFCGKDRIDEPHPLCDVIGTHSARRTFVVHALEMGWSPQVVMSYTGHEDYDTMKPYIALTDKTRKHLMETSF